MEGAFSITHHVSITPQEVCVDGRPLKVDVTGEALLSALYRQQIGNYPKFYKMDLLCKLGFIASELLLDAEQGERFVPREDRAVILFNETGSLHADSAFQTTIQQPEAFFPSPSVFVYTLPNIVTGEIAIRNKYYGESNFMVLPKRDDKLMAEVIEQAFQDHTTQSIITGWVDGSADVCFEADLYLVERGDKKIEN